MTRPARQLASSRHPGRQVRVAVLGVWCIVQLLALIVPVAHLSASPEEGGVPRGSGRAPVRPGEVVVVRLHSVIHPIAAEFVRDNLSRADRDGAAAVVLELDTTGGLATSTHDITTAILAARTPVVVYVAPAGAQAASAGFFILMAGDVAAMAPGTNTGAAHPVGPQGESFSGTLGRKIEQDAAAGIRALAARNGRPQAVAEQAVLESRSFTADEALGAHLVDLVAPSVSDLLHGLNGRQVRKGGSLVALHTAGAHPHTVEMSPWSSFLAALAEPDIAYLLLTLGGLGLVMELMHPTNLLPGVAGAVCLILAFFALSVLPVNYAGVALIVLGVALLAAEVKLMSHGLLTAGGVASLVFGALLLFSGSEPEMRVHLEWILLVAVFSVAVMGFLSSRALAVRRLPVRTGMEGLLRQHGIVRTPVGPADRPGKVFVQGELWRAVAASGAEAAGVSDLIPAGDPVEVVRVDDFTLAVRPLGRLGPTGGR